MYIALRVHYVWCPGENQGTNFYGNIEIITVASHTSVVRIVPD